MKTKSLIICIVCVLFGSTTGFSQQSKPEIYVAPNAPQDKSIRTKNNDTQKLNEAVKPYIELARKTYPEAKARFLKGLPPKHTFFITTRLFDSTKRFEQVFIAVSEIKDGKITGLIWNDIQLVSGFKKGDSYVFPETELIDWTIAKPDGTEEGNFVGKFLDTYQPQSNFEPIVWHAGPATPERMNLRIEELAIKYQNDAPIPRMVLYDIGYPHDEKEYAALDGNAVILITALTQERDELPIKRIYVLIGADEVELKLIKQVLSVQSAATSISAKTFGAYRLDALYVLPVYLRLMSVNLFVNFAKNKAGLTVATFGTPVSADVKKLDAKPPTGVGPSDKALEEFIKREYPGFFKQ